MTDHLYACTLSPAELANAASQYAQAASAYHGTVQFRAAGALVTLRGDKPRISALLHDMVAREGACCTHLAFDLDETADGYRVYLSAHGDPQLAQPILRATIPVLFPTAEEVVV